jgi:hypothetical protein
LIRSFISEPAGAVTLPRSSSFSTAFPPPYGNGNAAISLTPKPPPESTVLLQSMSTLIGAGGVGDCGCSG